MLVDVAGKLRGTDDVEPLLDKDELSLKITSTAEDDVAIKKEMAAHI